MPGKSNAHPCPAPSQQMPPQGAGSPKSNR
jgi:hypothetical protein